MEATLHQNCQTTERLPWIFAGLAPILQEIITLHYIDIDEDKQYTRTKYIPTESTLLRNQTTGAVLCSSVTGSSATSVAISATATNSDRDVTRDRAPTTLPTMDIMGTRVDFEMDKGVLGADLEISVNSVNSIPSKGAWIGIAGSSRDMVSMR